MGRRANLMAGRCDRCEFAGQLLTRQKQCDSWSCKPGVVASLRSCFAVRECPACGRSEAASGAAGRLRWASQHSGCALAGLLRGRNITYLGVSASGWSWWWARLLAIR